MILTCGLLFQGQTSQKEFFISINHSPQELKEIASELASEFKSGEEGFNVFYIYKAHDRSSQFEIGQTESYVEYLDDNVQLEERLSHEDWVYSIIIDAIKETVNVFELIKNELDWSEFIMTPLLNSLPR